MYKKTNKYQDKFLNNLYSLRQNPDIIYNSQSVSGDLLTLIQYINDFSPTERAVLDEFLLLDEKYKELYPKQQTIADAVGIERSYACTLINSIVEQGIMTSTYRHMKSCVYTINKHLKDPAIVLRFKDKFKTFKYRSRRLLLVAAASALSRKQLTQYNIIRNNTYIEPSNFKEFWYLYGNDLAEKEQIKRSASVSLPFFNKKSQSSMPAVSQPPWESSMKSNDMSTLDQIADLLRLNHSQKEQLELIDECVLKTTLEKLKKVDTTKLTSPFGYLKAIIKNKTNNPQRVYNASSGPNNIYRAPEERVYDPLEIANGITVLKNQDALNKVASLMGKDAATKYRDLVLRNWLNKKIDYNESDEMHKMAMHYINNKKKELFDGLHHSGATSDVH